MDRLRLRLIGLIGFGRLLVRYKKGMKTSWRLWREPGRHPKLSVRGRHKRSLVEGLGQLEESISTCCSALRVRVPEVPCPGLCRALHAFCPGSFLCGVSRRKNRQDKHQQVLNKSSQKQK